MTAAAIDLDTLNKLLGNQKKMDDIFDSIFDDDPFLNNPLSTDEDAFDDGFKDNGEVLHFEQDSSFYEEDFVQKKRNIIYLALPVVVEIAAIYFGISYFIG